MTNTQSPAPGVAAEAIELLEALMPDMSDSNEAEAKRIVKALRTAPPLPAQVPGPFAANDQLAPGVIFTLKATVYADHMDYETQAKPSNGWEETKEAMQRIHTESARLLTEGPAKCPFYKIASRTPAPGMAGGVVYTADLDASNKRALEEAPKTIARIIAGQAAPHPSPALQVPQMMSVGHQYLFTSPYGGDVWRDDPSEWNGNRPKASREIFATIAPQVATPGAGRGES